MPDSGETQSKPRDRIIQSAREQFRKHGVRGIGVDAIAEAAGSNKMTLYRHFGSKDDLVVACLREAALEADAVWAELEADHPGDPMAQLYAWVRMGAECVEDDGRGCEFANCAVELAEDDHPAKQVIEEVKTNHRDHLARLCKAAGIHEAELLADALFLLVEGARVNRQSEGASGACARMIAIGDATIAAFAKRG